MLKRIPKFYNFWSIKETRIIINYPQHYRYNLNSKIRHDGWQIVSTFFQICSI